MIKPSDLCAPPKASEKQTLDRPMDHLFACHRRIEERLATLLRVVPHLETRGDEARQAIHNSLHFFDTNGTWHTEDEERSIFPRLAAKLEPAEIQFIAALESEHQVAENAYAALKEAVSAVESNPSADSRYQEAAQRLQQIYSAHIATEDSTLLEMGRRLLSEAELHEISGEMKTRRGLKA
jgi:hemerythrin-like domain-containing protein